MKSTLIAALAMLLSAVSAGAGDHDGQAQPAIDDPRFDFLKRLEGSWIGQSGQEELAESVFEFRVTAGGHAIEEREMIGTPMEMVTLYHMEGLDLVATHYCILGNRPHLTAVKKIADDTLTFACNGKPGNAGSHDEEHVHGWSMRLDRDGRLHYSAELMKEGKVTEAPTVVLTRQ
jgi:hypothetical protein